MKLGARPSDRLVGSRAAPVESQPDGDRDGYARKHAYLKAKFVERVAGREHRNHDSYQHYKETQTAADPNARYSAGNEHSVRVIGSFFPAGELDDGGKHVEERNEVEDDAGGDQKLIGARLRLSSQSG